MAYIDTTSTNGHIFTDHAISQIPVVASNEIAINTPCASCGREEGGQWYKPCPSEECPSHWEEKGIPHPDHAISQSTYCYCSNCGEPIGKYQTRCTACTYKALANGQINYCSASSHYVGEAVMVTRRMFGITVACSDCAEKIVIGKEQIAAVTGGRK